MQAPVTLFFASKQTQLQPCGAFLHCFSARKNGLTQYQNSAVAPPTGRASRPLCQLMAAGVFVIPGALARGPESSVSVRGLRLARAEWRREERVRAGGRWVGREWRGRGFCRWVQAKAGQSPVPGSQWGAVSFWEPSSDPLLGTPAGCRDTWSVQDRSICPATSCSRSCQRPYHHLLHRHLMEMTCCRLTDLADTHGSPSACSAADTKFKAVPLFLFYFILFYFAGDVQPIRQSRTQIDGEKNVLLVELLTRFLSRCNSSSSSGLTDRMRVFVMRSAEWRCCQL